ncbi:hypothetical protein ACHAXA_000226 [Cyclostephanos tholiformis]|uniref:Uncharacterized protein n=1 Tax=Cyclostephanos tholiformis TaxID=382380 RepID=A0ABD3RBV7_9STRA
MNRCPTHTKSKSFHPYSTTTNQCDLTAVPIHTKSESFHQPRRHKSWKPTHIKSASFHQPRRHTSFHLPRRHDDYVVPQQDLHKIASAYLSNWIEYNFNINESGVRDNGIGNDIAALDDHALSTHSPNLHPLIASSPGTYPLKQTSTHRVAPLPMTNNHQLKGRSNKDECTPPIVKYHQGFPKNKDSSIPTNNSKGEIHRVNSTTLPHLKLGDRGSPQDILDNEKIEFTKVMDSLRLHDFVFILRSDRSWTYAIVADRRPDSILFVVDTEGNTKVLSKKRWIDQIRFVNPDAAAAINEHAKIEQLKKETSQKKKNATGQVTEVDRSSKACHSN